MRASVCAVSLGKLFLLTLTPNRELTQGTRRRGRGPTQDQASAVQGQERQESPAACRHGRENVSFASAEVFASNSGTHDDYGTHGDYGGAEIVASEHGAPPMAGTQPESLAMRMYRAQHAFAELAERRARDRACGGSGYSGNDENVDDNEGEEHATETHALLLDVAHVVEQDHAQEPRRAHAERAGEQRLP